MRFGREVPTILKIQIVGLLGVGTSQRFRYQNLMSAPHTKSNVGTSQAPSVKREDSWATPKRLEDFERAQLTNAKNLNSI